MSEPVVTGGCLCGGVRPSWRAYVAEAPWEPIPDDGLEHFAEGKPRS